MRNAGAKPDGTQGRTEPTKTGAPGGIGDARRARQIEASTPSVYATRKARASDDADMMKRLRAAAAMPDEEIDLTDPDAPLVPDWTGAVQGKFYRPVKRLKSFRID